MATTVRFAPSPTGHIHIGNARTALYNWLFAQQNGGRFVLRFDDTDTARSRQEFADQIAEDLNWLGVHPDRTEYQSGRSAAHDAAAERLKASGRLYPCYETSEELERRRKILLSRRLPPVYGREALALDEAARAALEAEGRKPHWRFLLPNFESDPAKPQRTDVHWDDLVRGPQTIDLASMSDPVLIREDGSYLYTLPSIVDDIDFGITHVIRGDDHVANTGAQIAVFEALGADKPVFGHHNLLTTASGEGLSKRSGALSIKALRETGYEAMAVNSLAALIGTSQSVRPVPGMASLKRLVDLSAASKSAAKFDPAELETLNAALVHDMAYEAVAERLSVMGVDAARAPAFWEAVRANCTFLEDAAHWWEIVTQPPAGTADALGEQDTAFVREAFTFLPDGTFDAGTWQCWTDTVKQQTGRKGRALFMPLRIALTGERSGPELANLLPLLGREGTLARRP